MTNNLNIAVVGAGAIALQHLDALARIDNAQVVALVDSDHSKVKEVAKKYSISHVAVTLQEVLVQPEIDAIILCTPTSLHAMQAVACLQAGKHVLVEIPLADTLAGAKDVIDWQTRTGLTAMVAHTRRFNQGHRWMHQQITVGHFHLRQLDVQTYFLRRSNLNARGEPRSWTDHLLWHHAAHTVDLFQYQTGEEIIAANALQGPVHGELGIALDMSIQLKSQKGSLCTLSLSFNNNGPIGTTFRYIGDGVTYIARYDELTDGNGALVDIACNEEAASGVLQQDKEFIDAIRERRQPNASSQAVYRCYELLHRLERTL